MARILLIDDDAMVRRALRAALERLGHSVLEARDGPTGLAYLGREAVDLVVLDRGLPGMTGSQVLREIRKKDKDMKIIVLTGFPESEGEEKYRALGIAAFLPKGVGFEMLLRTISRVLGGELAPETPRLLVVDDDGNVRNVLRRFFESRKFRVEMAGDGEDGLRLVRSFRPHLLLLDVAMPRMGGLEFLERLRAVENPPAVMMITGSGDVEIAKRCMQLGAYDYMVKPFELSYLESSVVAKIRLVTP